MIDIQGKLTLEEDIAFKRMILTDLNTLINKYTADKVGKLKFEKASAIVDKDDLLQAVSIYFYARKLYDEGLLKEGLLYEDIQLLRHGEDSARTNLFKVAGLIE